MRNIARLSDNDRRAVSYTHLDVYKRQRLCRIRLLRVFVCIIFQCDRRFPVGEGIDTVFINKDLSLIHILQDPCPENMPILGDLYELLLKQSEPEAQNIATALEKMCIRDRR